MDSLFGEDMSSQQALVQTQALKRISDGKFSCLVLNLMLELTMNIIIIFNLKDHVRDVSYQVMTMS